MRRSDNNNDGDWQDAGDRSGDFYLTDLQGSAVAIIDRAAGLVERITFDAYGEARHHWKQDVDGDGDIDSADQTAASNASGKRIYQSGYNVHADFNRDGIVNGTDTALVGPTYYNGALAEGTLSMPYAPSSSTGVDNVIGYCGYLWNAETMGGGGATGGGAGGIYTVRFRHYDTATGRWLERDPAGYMDSMSLYQYVGGNSLAGADPTGLMGSAFGLAKLLSRDAQWEITIDLCADIRRPFTRAAPRDRRPKRAGWGSTAGG